MNEPQAPTVAPQPRVRIRHCERTGAQWHALTRVLMRYPLGDLHLRQLICALASDDVCSTARPGDGVLHPRPLWFCALCAEPVCGLCYKGLYCHPMNTMHCLVCPTCMPARPLSCTAVNQWMHQRRIPGKRKRSSE
jgi:hypothetical protein